MTCMSDTLDQRWADYYVPINSAIIALHTCVNGRTLLRTCAQQYRALTMILKSHRTQTMHDS